MKSPNIRSTTGRVPVIAAPTASPMKPGSAIGVSTTRSVPNSSTRPLRTLKGVPASATSSPMMKTVLSRRISSASASLTAWDSVISLMCLSSSQRVFDIGENVHVDLVFVGIGGCLGVGDGLFGIRLDLGVHRFDLVLRGDALFNQPAAEFDDRVAVFLPVLLFFLGAVVFAVNIADVVTVIAVGHQFHKEGAFAFARAGNQILSQFIDRQNVLSINLMRLDTKGLGAGGDRAGGDFFGLGIFGVAVVFAGINDRQVPKCGHVHDLIHQALRCGPVAEETDGHIVFA